MQRPALLLGGFALVAFSPIALSQNNDELRAATAHRRSVELLEANPQQRFDPTTLLVRFAAGTGEVQRAQVRGLVGGQHLRSVDSVPGLELISTALPVRQAIQVLVPHVQYAEPNWIVRKDQTPNDTYFSLEWGMHNTGQTIQGDVGTPDADIDAAEAWDITTGDANFVIAIIDTGTQWSHADLDGNIWSNPGEIPGNGQDDDNNGYVDDIRGWDFYGSDNNPDDEDGHGSHTAGTVGAEGNNGIGVAGVNWQCKLVPLRFLGPQGGFTSDAVLAVDYCTSEAIKVSCNSWGGGGFSQALYDAINASKSVGHVFAAAAGNDGDNTDSIPHYPSSYNLDNIVSVAATDNQDGLANEPTWASNYGANSVDIGAPGVNIASTYNGSSYVWSSGTSMATPHVAGVAALVYAQNPGWTYSQVINQLYSSARPLPSLAGKCTTGAMLNAFAAVNGGGGGDTTPPADPSGLTANAGDGSVSLDWNNNGEGDLAGYRVYRSTSSGGGYSEIAGLVGSSDYVDNGVSNGTTYFYVVRAEDTSGNLSGDSNEASGTPNGGGGGPVSLFFGGFESGNFSAEGWVTSGNTQVSSAADQGGNYGARIKKSSWIERAVDTSGYADITLDYTRLTRNMDSGEAFHIEYWNGSSWINVESTTQTSWGSQSFALGGDAGNNGAFKIRFRTNANRNNERADLDDVEVIGDN